MFKLLVVIHFLTTKGKMVVEIHKEVAQMYENFINVSNVGRWKRDFENNLRVSLDEWRNGSPADSLAVDNICPACEILKADNCFTLDKIVAHMLPLRCDWSIIQTIIHDFCSYKNCAVGGYLAYWLMTTWWGTLVHLYSFWRSTTSMVRTYWIR